MTEQLGFDPFEARLARLLALHTEPAVQRIAAREIAHQAGLTRTGLWPHGAKRPFRTMVWSVAAALLVVVVGVGTFAWGLRSQQGPAGPAASVPAVAASPSPSPIVASPTPSPVIASPSPVTPPPATDSTMGFSSSLYGYSVTTPMSWDIEPASSAWPGGQLEKWYWADQFWHGRPGPHGNPEAWIAAQPLGRKTTAAAWLANWQSIVGTYNGYCPGNWSPPPADTLVAGISALRVEWHCSDPQRSVATYVDYLFVANGKGYVISGNVSMVDRLVTSFELVT
jgi:hypothetical protein